MIRQIDLTSVADSIRGFRSSRCPATDNAPVTMTERGWMELCEATRKAERKRVVEGHLNSSRCATCKGKQRPDNLHIIDIKEFEQMSKRPMQECDSCKETAMVRKNHGMDMCPTCASIFANVNNRIHLVAKAIVTLGKVNEAIRLLSPDMGTSATVPDDVTRALDCTPENWEMAAIQTAAMLEDSQETERLLYTDNAMVAAALEKMRERVVESEALCARKDDECNALAARVSDLEKSIEEDKDINRAIMASAEPLKPEPGIAVSSKVQSLPSVSAEVFNLALAQIEGKVSGLSVNRLRALARVQ